MENFRIERQQMTSLGRALVVGELVRFESGGPIYEIMRVSPCAAYPRKVYDPPRKVEIVDKEGKAHTILAAHGPMEPGISIHSKVLRAGDDGWEKIEPAVCESVEESDDNRD